MLDLGTGSGNLLLSILSELPIDADARGVGVDISPAAGTSAVLYKFALYIRSSARCCFLCYLTDSLIYLRTYQPAYLGGVYNWSEGVLVPPVHGDY